ncbi:MAG: hypothetical protein D6B25_12635 [Desulfobulbaceae bacterium]|nr:MAG: hypothetical protein D6B25_12635 [Desulfobulbaceae bacterium]
MDTNAIIDDLSNQLTAAITALEKASDTEEKVKQSVIVKNLSKSLNVFLTMPVGYQADDVNEDDESEINDAIEGKFL